MVMPPSLPTNIHDASHQEQAGRLRADASEAGAGALAAAPAIVWVVAGSLDLDPMICTPHKSKSLMIWTTLAPKIWVLKPFWHKRLQCKSYQRQVLTIIHF